MKIYHHWLHASMQTATREDITELARILQIEMDEFDITEPYKCTGTYYYTLKLPGSPDAVHITMPAKALHGTVTLKGAYFDNYPTFDPEAFRDFIKRCSGNFKRQDVTFEDDTHELDFKELSYMTLLENYQKYMQGSSVVARKKSKSKEHSARNRGGIPDPHTNHSKIYFGDINSSYCAKTYIMDNGNIKFELTVNAKKLSNTLIGIYDKNSPDAFNQLAKEILVKCVNFITPESMRAKRPEPVDSWRRFLGSKVKPVCWKDHVTVPKLSREDRFYSGLHRHFGGMNNFFKKFDIEGPCKELLDMLADAAFTAFDNQAILESG